MSSSKYYDRRHSPDRRDRSYSSRRDRDSRRRSPSPSPGPSRGRSPAPSEKPRDENELPFEFGRPESRADLNDNNVLKRMDTAYDDTPLAVLSRCYESNVKIKVWIRRSYEVRGFCSGYLEVFDKHWNMFLRDVVEYYVLPKHKKQPFLCVLSDKLKELQRLNLGEKVAPKEKKVAEEVPPKEIAKSERAKKRDSYNEKKKQRPVYKKHHKHLFIRGDNVALFGFCEPLNEPIFVPLRNL